MLRRDEVVQSLTGAWELFLDRPDAMRFFDVSADGFWRSFYAIILIVPAYALIAISERSRILAEPLVAAGFEGSIFVVNKGVTLAFDWITLPIVLALAAPTLGVSRNYAAFIVARNWCAVLSIALFSVLHLMFLLGIAGSNAASIMALVLLVVVIRYNFLIARRALNANIGLAIGVIIADFAISLAIVGTADRFVNYGVPML